MVFGLILGVFYWLCAALFWVLTGSLLVSLALAGLLIILILDIFTRSLK